jgi:hypothetical protein
MSQDKGVLAMKLLKLPDRVIETNSYCNLARCVIGLNLQAEQ